jgi:hypothetical protein
LKKIIVLIVLASATAIAVAATAGSDAAKPAEATALQRKGMSAMPGTALPSGQPAVVADNAGQANIGKVLEVIDSPMYTYLKVTSDTGILWLAAYKTDITKGSTVKYSNGVAMHKFYSKALNRTFDMIVFVDSLELVMN